MFMPRLNLAEVSRREVRVREDLPPDHPIWEGTGVVPLTPLSVDLTARPVGQGVMVSGAVGGRLEIPCRRCLTAIEWDLDEELSFWFEELDEEEQIELEGEVYPLPPRGTELDLQEPLREQLLLGVPEYLLCREECRGLCPHCGTDLNLAECHCVAEPTPGPWDALKKIKFD